ncbi:hypothetical protein LIER_14010 [Lithospermum erythrorhizon]|uniref:Cysteine-rich transmembrane CYSTM domain-containing protein n=1 Tax=Lithospermum erythrorhizon TaxID=34254 RepID=A0AAV3Q1N7_LITER
MSNFNQQEATYPQPPPAGNGGGPYVMAPPPIGYPTKDDSGWESCKHSSEDTTSRGDGFLKGCGNECCICHCFTGLSSCFEPIIHTSNYYIQRMRRLVLPGFGHEV